MFIRIVKGPGEPRALRRDVLLPRLGPSATLLAEQLVKWLPEDVTIEFDDIELAARMGLTLVNFHKVVKRMVQFGQARVDQSTGTAVLLINSHTTNSDQGAVEAIDRLKKVSMTSWRSASTSSS